MDHTAGPYSAAGAPGLVPQHAPRLPFPHPPPPQQLGRHSQLMPGPRGLPQMELKPNFYNPYQVKHRRRTTKEQLTLLEGTFNATPKPSSEVRKSLAGRLSMTAREVQIWFQNRRAKHKNQLLRASAAAASPPTSAATPTPAPADAATDDCLLVSALLPTPKAPRRDRPPAISSPPPPPPAAKQQLPPPAARRHSDVPPSYAYGEHAASVAGPGLQPTLLTAFTALDAVAHHQPPASLLAPAGQASTSRAAQQLKKKRADPDTDRYHMARVHHEAFDGTNKLPVKPDALMTAEDQLSMLDPANLPNFAMPGPSTGIGALGLAAAFPQQPQLPFGSAGPALWPVSYSQMLQTLPQHHPPPPPPQQLPPQPQTSIPPLYAGLLGMNGPPCSAPAISPFGLPAPCAGLGSPAPHSAPVLGDMQISSNQTLAFYQTLLLLSQQSNVPPPPLAPAPHRQQCSQGAMFMPGSAFSAPSAPQVGVPGLLPPELLVPATASQSAPGGTSHATNSSGGML